MAVELDRVHIQADIWSEVRSLRLDNPQFELDIFLLWIKVPQIYLGNSVPRNLSGLVEFVKKNPDIAQNALDQAREHNIIP